MTEWPLTGRDAELAHLATLLDDPAARGVVLAGPAGVGKSRLGQACLRMARERGFVVERISATFATSTLPLGAVVLSRPHRQSGSAAPHDQTELVHWLAGEIVRQADGRRLVLMVDDVHWLDQLSAVVIHQLAVTGSAFLVLTARTGSPAPEPIVALWKDDIVERMSVRAVSREVVEQLLSEVLDGPVAGAAVAELADRSEGNLLFLREQVTAAVEDGTLTKDAGVWRLTSGPGAPARLVELVELRLAGLDPAARSFLEFVAFGEPMEFAEAIGLADETLVEQMDRKGLISLRPDGWGGAKVLLAHPLLGEVLRAATSVVRARQITEQLASAAEERRPAQADELLRIASWRLVCGGGSAELMERAAVTAYARHDNELTARLARGAIAAGAGVPARLLLAEATGQLGQRSEAETALSALAAEATSPDQLAAIAHARMVNAHLAGDVALGMRVFREALDAIEDPRWRNELRAKRSWLVIRQEGPRGGMRATDDLWSEDVESSVLADAGIIRACALARGGRTTEAIEVARRAQAAQDASPGPFVSHRLVYELFTGEALAAAGRFAEWEELADRSYAAAVSDRAAVMQMFFSYQRAKVALACGQVATAARLAGESIGIGHQLNDSSIAAGLTTLAEALALRGDIEGAARALAELDTVPQTPWIFSEPDLARAWLAVARGDLVSARRLCEDEVERAMAWDDLRAASLALHSLVRIGHAKSASQPLAELAERMEGDLVRVQASHAAAMVARDGKVLAEVAEAFHGMGAKLLAAEAYSDAAVAFRAEGNSKKAASLAQRASVLLGQCEGAITPAAQPVSVRTELTQAERATAMLAAGGWSNRAIADAEQVSVRTVESRLQVVYTKLGISSRRDLAESLEGSPGRSGP